VAKSREEGSRTVESFCWVLLISTVPSVPTVAVHCRVGGGVIHNSKCTVETVKCVLSAVFTEFRIEQVTQVEEEGRGRDFVGTTFAVGRSSCSDRVADSVACTTEVQGRDGINNI
jgi:hypothetical protein